MAWNKANLWTETHCPWPHLNGGHTRDECETKRGRSCIYRRREVENARNARNRLGRGQTTRAYVRHNNPVPVVLDCSHTVLYRVFTRTEKLWCQRCDAWMKQWKTG